MGLRALLENFGGSHQSYSIYQRKEKPRSWLSRVPKRGLSDEMLKQGL